MLMVAICDDEQNIGAELESALINIFSKLNVKYAIDVFLAGDKLCRHLEAGSHYDLIFLDIEFSQEKINGVEIGGLIRNAHHNNIVSIVYISWEKKYAMELFETRPLNFLVKPLELDKIERTVATYLKIAGLLSGEFTYKKGHDTFKLQVKDIIYFENSGRKVIIHLADGSKKEFYGSLKEIYNEQLKGLGFLFIHGSYVVNYDYITVVKYDQLFLTGSAAPLPISPSRRNEVRKHYLGIMKQRRV